MKKKLLKMNIKIEIKYLEEKLHKRTDMAEGRHNELEDKSRVITQNVAQRE